MICACPWDWPFLIVAAWWIDLIAKTLQKAEAFWAMVAALATIGIVLVAWLQLKRLASVSKATFLYKLKLNFFRSRTRKLLFLVKHDCLRFCPTQHKELAFFNVLRSDGVLSGRMDAMGITQQTISTEEVDDFLLGPLEDVGMFCEEQGIDLRQACKEFAPFLEYVCQSDAIKRYIKWVRESRPNHSNHWKRLCRLCKACKERVS